MPKIAQLGRPVRLVTFGTYCEPNTPDVDQVAPFYIEERLRCSIHRGHDISSMGPGSQPRLPEIGEEKRAALGFHETRKVDGSVRQLFAGYGV